MASRAQVVSSFTVIKGTLIEPTYQAFALWDLTLTKKQNLDRFKATDPFGAGSANWWRDLAKAINRRFDPSGRDRPLVRLAAGHCPLEVWRPLLLWHMTRDEFLVRDFLVNFLYPLHADGTWRVRTSDVIPYLRGLHGRTDIAIKEAWSEDTEDRVASGLLRLAGDFGLMTGTISREFVSYHLPEPAFLYLLHAIRDQEPNIHRLVHNPEWRMFLMGPEDVQRELFRLHQFQRVHYEVAGSIAQLQLPCVSASAYAEEMAS